MVVCCSFLGTVAMNSTASEKPQSFFDTIKLLAEISIVFGTGLFLIGWSYLFGYYRVFGLRIIELNLSPQTMLVYSLPVLENRTFYLTFFSALAILAIVCWRVPAFASTLSRPLSVIIAVAAAYMLCSWLAIRTGMENGKRDAFLSTSTLPHVKFEGTTDAQTTGCRMDEWNYLLLLRANGQVYVVDPIDDAIATAAPNLRVCVFPESRMHAIRIQVGLDGT
jgi:hypothetical protein